MTAQARRKPKLLQAEMADVMVVLVTVTVALVIAVRARVIVATVSRAVILQTVASAPPVWVIPLSVPNAKPWNAPRCRCASWRPKPMARP